MNCIKSKRPPTKSLLNTLHQMSYRSFIDTLVCNVWRDPLSSSGWSKQLCETIQLLKQSLKIYSVSDTGFVWFSDEKIFTLATPKNSPTVYACCNEEDIGPKCLLRTRVTFVHSLMACGLGLDVSVSRPSRDVLTSRLGLVSDKVLNVSVSSRSRLKRSWRLVSGLGPFRLVETFHRGAPCKTSVLRYIIQVSMP